MSQSDLSYAEKALLRARIACDQEDWGQVIALADEAIQHKPDCPEAFFLLGRAATQSKLYGLATQLYHIGTKLAPNVAPMWNNLGVTLQERDEEGAYKAFRKAYELNPKMTSALSSLCAVCVSMGRYDEALNWAELCLKEDASAKDALYNSSLALLALGRWAEAWPKYNVCLGIKDRNTRNYHGEEPTPRWNPDTMPRATVVIYGEQGIGDEIMFASMIPDAIKAAEEGGGRVILETDARLEGLYKRSFPGVTVYPTRGQNICEWVLHEKPTARLECGGLGDFFGAEPRRGGAFLEADSAKRAMARAWLDSVAPANKRRIGIAWTGGSWATGRRQRSLPLEALGPLLSAPDVEWFCLEYDDPRDDLEAIERLHGVKIHDPRSFVARKADYDDTAAFVSELDLVIAPTTSVVDLCGALGVPVWAFAPHAPPWRYSDVLGPDKMFWYESATVFRQKDKGLWGAPIAKAAAQLRGLELKAA